MKATLLVLGVLVVALAAVLVVGAWRWRAGTAAAVARLSRSATPSPPRRFTAADLAGLPVPVARYFRAVLREGQPYIRSMRARQTGQFLVRPAQNVWRPFEARQYMAAQPAGFVWDARIRMAPGVTVRVRDALLDGSGSMLGKVLGLFTVVRSERNPGITAGAMHRYLAEAVWCPTALLPANGVGWTAVDDSTARAALTLRETTVTLEFHFGPDSLVRSVYTPERQYEKDGRFIPMPWRGRLTGYEERNGVRVPVAAEVEWLLPEGPQPYWRGRLTEVLYDEEAAR